MSGLRIFACALAIGVAGCAHLPGDSTPIPASSAMPDGAALDAAPDGYLSFCRREPAQCTGSAPQRIALDRPIWDMLNRVNSTINDTVIPEDDQEHYGVAEYWTTITDGHGDCEDYALTKRKWLAQAGLPMSALRIAIAVTPQGEQHAVLSVATLQGDYVLDNRAPSVLPWRDTGYRWVARQDPVRPLGWVALDTRHEAEIATASIWP